MQKKIKISEMTGEMIEKAQKGQIKIDLWTTMQTNSDWGNSDKDVMLIADIVGFETRTESKVLGGNKNKKTCTTTFTYAIGRDGKKEFQHKIEQWEGEAEPRSNNMELGLKWYVITEPDATVESGQPVSTAKKPVYTISLDSAGWASDNLEQPGNGRITMGAPETTIESEAGKNTLFVSVRRCARGAFGHDFPYEVIEIQSAYLETPDGEEYTPTDLIDRIEIEGYRRVWSGAYVETHEGWITAAEAQRLYSVAPATVRQAINREIVNGHVPEWARKSAGTWLVRAIEAKARWGKKDS